MGASSALRGWFSVTTTLAPAPRARSAKPRPHQPYPATTMVLPATNLLVAGSTIVVAGDGWGGPGLAPRARGGGANGVGTETGPPKARAGQRDGERGVPKA